MSGQVLRGSAGEYRLRFDLWVREIPLEKEMATHSSILAWRIPWTEEPGGLQRTTKELDKMEGT